jgi:lipopolysaccharide heptosyltransferase II
MRARLRTQLLRAAAWSSRPFIHPPTAARVEAAPRVLLIRPDHIGDLLFATPAIHALRSSLGNAQITCLVGPWAAEILATNRHLDEVMTCPFPGFARRPKRHLLEPYSVLWACARDLRIKSYDVAVVLRFDHWWGAMLAYYAGIPRRVGYAMPSVAPFLTEGLPYSSGKHEVEQNMGLVAAVANKDLGHPGPLEFAPGEQALRSAADLLAPLDPRRPYLCLHPGAGAPVKLWRPEAFAQVGDTLARSYGLQVVITGSAREKALAQSIAGRMETKTLVVVGQTDVEELAAILGKSRLVIGVDSGPLHLAVSQGAPTIHLFGPVDHRTFGPWGDPQKHIVLVAKRECIPCNRLDYGPDELDDHPCVRSISVAQVLEAADSLLRTDSSVRGGVV